MGEFAGMGAGAVVGELAGVGLGELAGADRVSRSLVDCAEAADAALFFLAKNSGEKGVRAGRGNWPHQEKPNEEGSVCYKEELARCHYKGGLGFKKIGKTERQF